MANIHARILTALLSIFFATNIGAQIIVEHVSPSLPIQSDSLLIETSRTADSILSATDTLQPTADTIPVKHLRRKDRIRSYVERRGMITRDDLKNVFIPKGQWMLGGQVAWNQWDNDNLNYLVLKDINLEGYTFSAGPYFGYFFANNMAVGGRFSYTRYFLDLGKLDVNLGEDFNIGLKDLYYLQHNYETTLFVRSYLPLGKSKIFGLFGEFQLNYTHSEGKNTTGSGDTYTSTFENLNSFEIGIAGGMTVFITDYMAAEVMLNVGGYRIKWGNQNTNNIEEGKILTSGANFRINLFSIKFGVTYYL